MCLSAYNNYATQGTAALKPIYTSGTMPYFLFAGDKMEIWDSKKHKEFFDSFSSDAFSELAQQVLGGAKE